MLILFKIVKYITDKSNIHRQTKQLSKKISIDVYKLAIKINVGKSTIY